MPAPNQNLNPGDKLRVCVAPNEYKDGEFIQYTHPFNQRCGVRFDDETELPSVSVYDIQKKSITDKKSIYY